MKVDFGTKLHVWNRLGKPVFGADLGTLASQINHCVDYKLVESLAESLWRGINTPQYATLCAAIWEFQYEG